MMISRSHLTTSILKAASRKYDSPKKSLFSQIKMKFFPTRKKCFYAALNMDLEDIMTGRKKEEKTRKTRSKCSTKYERLNRNDKL